MKKILVLVFSISSVAASAQVKPKPAATKPVAKPANPVLKSAIDSFSYAAGLSIAESMQQAGVTKLNSALMARAMDDMFQKRPSLLSKDEANMTLQQKLKEFGDKKSAAAKAEGMAYLETNKKKQGITALPNGLQYEILQAGDPNGMKPKAVDTVVVNYIGTLTNGTEFDNSFKRGQPASFPLNGVIRGWTEILRLMTKGAKWKVYIPGDLAYGENPPPGAPIPPNAVLVFEISLEDIKPAKAVGQ